jgi:hypothetical protein
VIHLVRVQPNLNLSAKNSGQLYKAGDWHYLQLVNKIGGDQYIAGPGLSEVGGDRSPPVPMVVAPMGRVEIL